MKTHLLINKNYFFFLTVSTLIFSSRINAQIQSESRLTGVAIEVFEPGINDFVQSDSINYSWAQGEGLGSADYTKFPFNFWEWYTSPPFSLVNTPVNDGLTMENVIKSSGTTFYNWNTSSAQYENTIKNTITLDANGNISEILTFKKINNVWVKYAKQNFTYVNNKRTQEVIQISPDGINWENQSKKNFVYYSNNELKTYTFFEGLLNNQWKKKQKLEFSYDNGNISETKIYDWDSNINNWPTNAEYKTLYYFNNNNECDSLLQLRWSSNESTYAESMKEVYSYNSNSQITKKVEYDNGNYNPSTSRPANNPFYQRSYTYNFSYLTEVLAKTYNDQSSTFENYAKYSFIYDGELLVKNEARKWDTTQNAWVPQNHYSVGRQMKYYYEPISSAGLSDIEHNISVNLYPNPSHDKITIEIEDDFIKNIEITNQNGQVVYKNNNDLHNKQVTLPVHQLNQGLYYVKISSNSNQSVKSLIIE